ncbi:hypothetical protein B0T16DRAFT_139666 [Cercophora newfieldiana]|uniref:Uncharacterized protein n=1 Tax=Cercophora newfieldiana TaxID=92897 RepID=A0AA39Y5S5_9PEZI|nr:hypothetical protein B0T16DRAFT_139666 [Cercophora newfieldiana]
MALYLGTATLAVPTQDPTELQLPHPSHRRRRHRHPSPARTHPKIHRAHSPRPRAVMPSKAHPSSRSRRPSPSPAKPPLPQQAVKAKAANAPKPSRITTEITKRTDAVLDHVILRVTDLREEQQRGTTEWVNAELERTAEWVVRLRAEQQAEMQREMGRWLEGVPEMVMGRARDVFVGWLGGSEGLVTAVLAWLPVVLGAGGAARMGWEVVSVMRRLVRVLEGGKGRRGLR